MAVSEIEYQLRSPDATWCYARWQQLPDDGNRYEVIDGVLYMSTAPSFWHAQIIIRLIELIGLPMKAQGVAIPATAPIGVIMEGADPVQPDFLLIRRERASIVAQDGRVRGVPDLIAEVLSPSNRELDTVVKRAAYARAGVPEYWIVRPETRDVLVCSQPDATLADFTDVRRYSAEHAQELLSATFPLHLPVAALFEDAAG